MPNYRRAYRPGGTFFFTVVARERQPILCTDIARQFLRQAMEACQQRYPFTIDAFVLLPDHLHAIWTLPEADADFSRRWALIKLEFTKRWRASGGGEASVTQAELRERRAGVWQPRFWEHLIADQDDLNAHLDYVHWNPVKHGYAKCPNAWPYSSFHRLVQSGLYDRTWRCACDGRIVVPPTFDGLDETAME